MNDTTVSKQWASRPDDQRYLTVDDLAKAVHARRKGSRVDDVALDQMQLLPTEDGEGIGLTDRRGVGGLLNHWSFGQLCARAKAPAGYLRTLPAQLAAIPLQWSLEKKETRAEEGNDAKLLVRREDGLVQISAVTSATYGRIWDADVVEAVRGGVDLTRWKVPGASYAARDPKRATTLYASDRDVFMFLVDEDAVIEASGERVKRGFYVWNSEVGSATFGLAAFTYDYVCDNRIIWGQKDFTQLTIRHTSGGPHRFIRQAVPQIKAYAESSAAGQAEVIRRAKATEVGKDRESVLAWMKARGFTAPVARAAYDAAEADPRGYSPRSVWGLVQGVTDAAHEVAHTDARVDLEARAGKLLEALA